MTMCTIRCPGRPFGPDGCQVPVGSGTCGETRTLEIINEFKRLYEDKIQEIESTGGGDCLQEKIKLQQDWIGDLTAQNEMLVKAVEELEREATERVHVLEEKLQQSAQSICEVMKRYREFDVTNDLLAEPLQKVFCLESDQKNLLEFIRRAREENRWDVDGLKFYEVSYKDLFGSKKRHSEPEAKIEYKKNESAKSETKLKCSECCINELQKKLDYYKQFDDVECLTKELQCKREECLSLQRSMKDTQQALVEEIASKHDSIVQLRKECQQLEERCIQADKQTVFRDDIIKELRKEIKQLKQQKCQNTNENNETLKAKIEELKKEKESLERERRALGDENVSLKEQRTLCEQKIRSLEEDKNALKVGKIALENTVRESKAQVDSLGKDFKEFLKVKGQLKQVTKATEKRCNEIGNKNKKLKLENHKLKADIENLATRNKQLEDKLKATKDEIDAVKCDTIKCDDKKEENEKLLHEMLNLNEENRGLLKTVEMQRKRIDRTTKLTQDEIVKLNETIDELHGDLQKTKNLQEEEEKRYETTISQLKNTIKDLVSNLKHVEEKYERDLKLCKICRGRTRVGFSENTEVQASFDAAPEEQMETIQKRDEIIKVQTDTLNLLEMEVHSLKEMESDLRKEREQMSFEIQVLKNRVSELENELEDAEEKAANLQTAVDLYLNSISVLEVTEDKYKVEMEQQKYTICNLQKALVAAKQELDEIKQRSQENVNEQHGLISCFNFVMADMETDTDNLAKQCEYLSEEYDRLEDMNFDLEIEHCSSLQDAELLENQLFKYQSLLRCSEDECNHYKNYCHKLAKQKKCYEEIVAYFKQEMGSMSDQLRNLQELLTISNESCQEENCKLIQAYKNVQAENERLSTKLAAAEQQATLEGQMNQLNETKICELEQMISERELDLNRHDQAILNIRQSLQCSLAQNEALQSTIVELHETIAQLKSAVQTYEAENCRGKESTQQCWTQILGCKQKLDDLKAALDEKTTELCKLEMAYNSQTRALKAAQLELKEMREKQKDKQRHLKAAVEELREKLTKSEENYCKVCCEVANLKADLTTLARKEAVKDLEVKRYRKIVNDLKSTLIDLNKSLASGKDRQILHVKCKYSECRVQMQLAEEPKNQDICYNCPCEVEFYQSIVKSLKKSVVDLKKKLNETQQINQQLEEAGKLKDAQLEELSTEKDKEYNDLRRKLTEKLKQAQAEEARYLELATQFEKELTAIREELEVKTLQLNDVKKSAQEINSSKCIQLVCAQEEVNALKDDLNRILREHCSLNAENEKLHAQSACMQATVSKLEEKSHLLKGQLEQYLAQLQNVQTEKETLLRKNCELLSELRSLQSTFDSVHKQQRYAEETVRSLESELDDLRANRDEVCLESKNVVKQVRAWLWEQKKINEEVARRERDYCDTIERLKRGNQECSYLPPSQRPCKKVVVPCLKSPSPPPACASPWSLGSQGTVSAHSGRSPSRSPCPGEESDWYSTNFRNDSEEDDEEDEDEEDWVTKVEHLAAQVRRTNKMWKNKMSHPDDVVSRDTKK